MPVLQELKAFAAYPVWEIGAKAYSLVKLSVAGVSVPRGFVLPCSIFEKDLEEILRTVQNELLDNYSGLLAVRSSFVGEDGRGGSFAGQFRSFVGVHPKDLADTVKRVALSGQARRVKEYAANAHVPLPKCAVLVQELINSQVSGVLFTNNPITGASDEILIESTFGQNEPLVSGAITPDLIVVKKGSRRICRKEMGTKEFFIYQDPMRRVVDNTAKFSLGSKQLSILLTSVGLVDDAPSDIEWTFDFNNRVFFLQKRPMTAFARV